jgi:hypothetical protein
MLLMVAFSRRLTFTMGRKEIKWNGISHKISKTGGKRWVSRNLNQYPEEPPAAKMLDS